jgi:hypothetical protein
LKLTAIPVGEHLKGGDFAFHDDDGVEESSTVRCAVVPAGCKRAFEMVGVLTSGFFHFFRLVGRMRASSYDESIRIPVFDVSCKLEGFAELRSAKAEHVNVGVHDGFGKVDISFVALVEHGGDDYFMALFAEQPSDVEHSERDVRF